jgi:hypothetical protein
MGRVTDQNNHATLSDIAFPLAMDLGDERTSGVQNAQTARLRILLDEPRNAMRAEDGDGSGGHLREILDETRASCAQALDDMAIVYDFVPDVDGCAKLREGPLHDFDGSDYTSAETARLSENHAHASDLSSWMNDAIECIGGSGGELTAVVVPKQ